MSALEVLREATAFRSVAALHAYPDALAQVEALVAAADELRLWEPGRKGYATAQDKLFAALKPLTEPA